MQKAVDEGELLNKMSFPQIPTGTLQSVKQLLARAAGTGENPRAGELAVLQVF